MTRNLSIVELSLIWLNTVLHVLHGFCAKTILLLQLNNNETRKLPSLEHVKNFYFQFKMPVYGFRVKNTKSEPWPNSYHASIYTLIHCAHMIDTNLNRLSWGTDKNAYFEWFLWIRVSAKFIHMDQKIYILCILCKFLHAWFWITIFISERKRQCHSQNCKVIVM